MTRPAPSAKQLEDFAFVLTVVLVGLLAGTLFDASDGVARMRGSTFRLVEDPAGFRGALITRWGFPALLAAVGAVASGIGALVLKAAEKASTGQ